MKVKQLLEMTARDSVWFHKLLKPLVIEGDGSLWDENLGSKGCTPATTGGIRKPEN